MLIERSSWQGRCTSMLQCSECWRNYARVLARSAFLLLQSRHFPYTAIKNIIIPYRHWLNYCTELVRNRTYTAWSIFVSSPVVQSIHGRRWAGPTISHTRKSVLTHTHIHMHTHNHTHKLVSEAYPTEAGITQTSKERHRQTFSKYNWNYRDKSWDQDVHWAPGALHRRSPDRLSRVSYWKENICWKERIKQGRKSLPHVTPTDGTPPPTLVDLNPLTGRHTDGCRQKANKNEECRGDVVFSSYPILFTSWSLPACLPSSAVQCNTGVQQRFVNIHLSVLYRCVCLTSIKINSVLQPYVLKREGRTGDFGDGWRQ